MGFAPDGSQVNAVYGDYLGSNELGSGGGGDPLGDHPGGNGGGLVGIYANDITLNGNIHANGGGSAGGRVAIYAGDISGFDVSGVSVSGGYGNSSGDGEAGTIYIGSGYDCAYDFNGDGDVDGSNLADFITDFQGQTLETFAADFGKTNCLQD